jgi:hypothetical protein
MYDDYFFGARIYSIRNFFSNWLLQPLCIPLFLFNDVIGEEQVQLVQMFYCTNYLASAFAIKFKDEIS